MSALARPYALARVASTSASSSSRALSTSAPLLAPKAKAPVKKPAQKKRAVAFQRAKPGQASGSGSGGARSSNVTLRYSDARPPPDLSDLTVLHPEAVVPKNVGKAATIPKSTWEKLRTLGLPRRIEKEVQLDFGRHEPSADTVAVRERRSCVCGAAVHGQPSESAREGEGREQQSLPICPQGSGKSVLQMQAVSYALESGWIVLSIPRASEWIDSSYPYAYDASSKTFHQPSLAAHLLGKLLAVNEDKVSSVPIEGGSVTVDGSSVSAESLAQLCRAGQRDEKLSVGVLEQVMDLLAAQTRYPVLLAVDEAQALFSRSEYHSPQFEALEAYHLSTPLLVLDYLTGRKAFNRGAVLASLSHSTPSLPIPVALISALQLPTARPVLTPYTPLDATHVAHASSGLEQIPVGPLSGLEAAGAFEILNRKGWVAPSDETFFGALAASSGNAGEFVRGLHRTQQVLA